jgi:sulfotransferase family protein
VSQTGDRIGKARIAGKLEFLEAADPAQALLDYFRSMGAKARGAHQQGGVRSLPLILISQLSRSGGSLLSQLFDGHPELHVYPWEMKIGYPSKGRWPVLDLRATPDHLFATLFHGELAFFARKGYRKIGKAQRTEKRLKFNYSPIEHYQNFVEQLPCDPTRRSVLDTYFSTLFEAWQPEMDDAAAVVGFVPKMAFYQDSIASFFNDYPDGRLISILRDPADWFASRRAHTKEGQVRYNNIKEELANWNQMARNALQYQRDYGDQFLLLSFKDLVTDREGTMRRLAAWCGVDFDPCLLCQTFDGNPISPNTNFDDPVERLAEAVLDRKQALAEGERERVYALTAKSRLDLQNVGWTG